MTPDLSCLVNRQMYSQVAKHAADLAEAVVQQQVMPAILQALTDEDHSPTRRCAAAVVQQVSRRTLELAEVDALPIRALILFFLYVRTPSPGPSSNSYMNSARICRLHSFVLCPSHGNESAGWAHLATACPCAAVKPIRWLRPMADAPASCRT